MPCASENHCFGCRARYTCAKAEDGGRASSSLGEVMRHRLLSALACAIILTTTVPNSAKAQQTEAAAPAPATIEGYYKIKWGAFDEFMALYEKNHLPILKEAKARGIITDLRIDVPFTHMAGGVRWDLRVAITYRSADAALVTDPDFWTLFDEVETRLKADNPKFDEEEARRFSLLEEHWDVVLVPQS